MNKKRKSQRRMKTGKVEGVEIKPCWRCGAEAETIESPGCAEEVWHFVVCTKCDAEGLGISGRNAKKYAVEWWNQRA